MKGTINLLISLIIASYSCGITAQITECENATVADIVFLVDGSTSIGNDSFQEVRYFLRNIIKALTIGPNKVRIGLAQYSNEPYEEFLLKDHMDKKSLLAAVQNLPYREGGTETGKALDYIRTVYFTKDAGSRASQNVPQIAVVLTDGESVDDVKAPALRLKQSGVVVFSIGVGQFHRQQLESIANWPPNRFLLTTDSFEALTRLTDGLLQTVCESMDLQFQALAKKYADVFFLVDSGIGQGQLAVFKSELIKLINQINAGGSTYRIGLAQYSQVTSVEFLLNAFQTRQELLDNVRRFRLRPQRNQPRDLVGALQYARTNFFTSEAGGRARQGSRQFLVVIPGIDPDYRVIKEAEIIKSNGITIKVMSAGASLDSLNYLAIASDVLGSVHLLADEIMNVKTEVITEDCKRATVADIVFIVDESESITQTNFNLVRSFMASLVSSLNVSHTRVRVGIVTFSDTPTAHVYLNTFKDKAEILQFIRTLPYRPGGTKTGAALKFTLENIFIEKRGSRKGVQKVAVLITDGDSQDDVTEAAASLRRAGITVYAVGIENANMDQLKQIASHPPSVHVFTVDCFTKLKALKETMQKIVCNKITVVTTTITTTTVKEACTQKDEADIYFLIDDSGSINNTDFYDMQKFMIEFIHTFHIGPQHVRMGVVKYAKSPHLEFDLTVHSDSTALEKAVLAIGRIGGATNTGTALTSMTGHFEKAAASRRVQQYLIVITDGNSDDAVKGPAEKLRANGVIIYAIGVKNSNETQLLEIAGDPKKNFTVNDFDALKHLSSKIITDICSPDACKDVPGDVFFLTDSSGSISTEDFQKMKDFMKSVISKAIIGQDKKHVGVMQFSTDHKLEFSLTQYYSHDEMSKVIDAMQQMNKRTHTGQAITEVSAYFDVNRGGRPHLKQWLIVITDGGAQDEVKGPAAALRAKGVTIYTIGVRGANTAQLLEISGSQDRVYVERDFDALKDLESTLALELCDPRRDCKKIEKADIIFLVDGSGNISPTQLKNMQDFMKSVVNLATVGKNLTRFGVIHYSAQPETKLTLEACISKQIILTQITDLRKLGGRTYTGRGLQHSLEYFTAKHGGRKALKVPQILMVITDGRAQDREVLKKASDALRKSGVTVLSVGVQNARMDELETMAGDDSSKAFFVDRFEELETLHKKVSPALCNATEPVCEKDLADMVFLLDRSGSIPTDSYNMMKNFTADVVKSLKVGEDFVRVGIAQFSKDLKDEFNLNTYFKKDDMIANIERMEYLGGETHLGKALEKIKNYFTTSQGSRRGVPKNLIVISDGDSYDDVEEAADELRALNIEVFSIGIGDVHNLELLQICGSPERLFTAETYSGLANIKKKVISEICKPQRERTDCTIDIAVGFDISRRSGAPGEMLTSGHPQLKTSLPDIVYYISEIKKLCCFQNSPFKTKIAFQVVDRGGNPIYDTNFEDYNEDVVKKVMRWEISRPTFFNTALINSFKRRFSTQSNAGVKVAMIFSDGLDEDVWTLENQAELLRQSGVSALLVVALEGAKNPAQLQMVEFGRGFNYKLPLSISMPSVGSSILKQIDLVSERECCNVTCKCSGSDGPPGDRGGPGPKGLPGRKGQRGFPGEEGFHGTRGPPGLPGPQGIQGCPGQRGQKGYRGVSGEKGDSGDDGLVGINGEQGLKGSDGLAGEKGHPGIPGITGIKGMVGEKGQRGLRGDPGTPGADNNIRQKGDRGRPGPQGVPGVDGKPGGRGDVGNPGPDGRRGPDGAKGLPGDPGATGLPGIPGAQGPQGRRGTPGERGPKGISGYVGRVGDPGPVGDQGLPGRRGPNGQKGQPGDPGVKGAPGPQGPRGMPGYNGNDGYGPQGLKGAKGYPGFTGHPGLPGEDGDLGTKGDPGTKGGQGRSGDSGRPGGPGTPGGPGFDGHMGPKGAPGVKENECNLITYIRDHCACCSERCPSYPTELVFGLDMSEDVTATAFETQRSALLSLLKNINISESNCPSGARISVVTYSADIKYLIRFQDYRRKKQLIEYIESIPLERSSNQRLLGAAMRFVGHNIFKRTRSGLKIRKVAVFFSNGQSQDNSDIVTAVMEYRARNIVPAVISLRNAPSINQAFEVDDTGNSIFTVLGRDMDAGLRKVKNCAICYDPCRRSEECAFIQETLRPQQVNLDLVMVADGSREMQANEFAGVQQLLGSVVEQLAVSTQPRRAGNQARVAVVQQSGTQATKVEFGLQTYQNTDLMRRHLIQNMQQQGGSSALGQALDYSLNEVLLKATQPRRRRALLTVVGTQTAYQDRAKLHYISQKAKCEGVAMFVVTVGEHYNRTQVEELASLPVQQHLIHMRSLRAEEQGYAQRFFRVFLSALNKGMNTYPPPSLKRLCSQLREPDVVLSTAGQGSAELEEDFDYVQDQTIGVTELGFINTLTQQDDLSSLSGPEPKDACLLSQDAGSCQDYIIKWYFNSKQKKCSRFWYSGCGGNENRFETMMDCQKRCLPTAQ